MQEFYQEISLLQVCFGPGISLGTSHLSLDEPSKALMCLKAALDLDPVKEDIPSIYSYMAVCLNPHCAVE